MTDFESDGRRELPLFPLGSVALPGVGLPLHVFEPRYRALVMTSLSSDRLFGSVLIARGSEIGGGDQRNDFGTLVRIIEAQEDADGRWLVTGVGIERLRVHEWLNDDPFPRAVVESSPDTPNGSDTAPLLELARSLCVEVRRRTGSGADLQTIVDLLDPDPSVASFQLLALSTLGPSDQYTGLCAPTTAGRLEFLCQSLRDQLADLDAIEALHRRESYGE
ncbi:MAG: LON peptidase substrate-binding domain-containing protein [Actinobacteria bacterium]|nr:LON peptidase substrate-binding domain-containing protein [Actinomycetota bacterium]